MSMCLCGMLVTFLTVGSKEPKKKKATEGLVVCWLTIPCVGEGTATGA